MNEFQVMRAGHNTFDVFAGTQWSTWTRLKSGRNGVYVAAGERLPHRTVKALAQAINPRQPHQLVKVDHV